GLLTDYDLSLHTAVDPADVAVRPALSEGVRIVRATIHDARSLDMADSGGHASESDGVAVNAPHGPRHLRSRLDPGCGRGEEVVLDRHSLCRRVRRRAGATGGGPNRKGDEYRRHGQQREH